MKNPTRPNDSPIKVEHAGEYDPTEYRNYVQPSAQRRPGLHIPVFGRNRGDGITNYEDIHDYQKSKTPEAKEDKALEAAIQRDLRQRNIK